MIVLLHLTRIKQLKQLPLSIQKKSLSITSKKATLGHKKVPWKLPGDGVRFRVPALPKFPQLDFSRILKAGKKIEKGVPLSIFTKKISKHLLTFQRVARGAKTKAKVNYSDIINEIYARRLNDHYAWGVNTGTRRFKIRHGHSKNPLIEFGLPNLRGYQLRGLWNDLMLIDWERRKTANNNSVSEERGINSKTKLRRKVPVKTTRSLGFAKTIEALESRNTEQNRQQQKEGLEIIRTGKTIARAQIQHSDPLNHFLLT